VNNPSDEGTRPDEASIRDAAGHDGRVVLVTGGTRGIGRTIAARYAGAGAAVVACGRTEPGDLPHGVEFAGCDVRDPDQVDALVAGIVDRRGRLDVAVNNAGGAPYAESATVSPRFNERVVALNLLAPFTVAQAANRVMQAQPEGGTIVNVTSVSGTRPSPGSAAYGAAKAGLLNLTQTLAVEWAPKVRVNAIVAGIIATEAVHETYGDDATIARVAATIPAGRMGTGDDVAAACLFLSSPAAAFVSGAALQVHGGNESPAWLRAFTGV
jgi:NAD(P)-dependent dehydrogenase (short-subunit alcohol dehydrogenase family)